MPVFNAQLRWLADEVEAVLPRGSATIVPPFARLAYLEALEASPPSAVHLPPRGDLPVADLAREAARIAGAEHAPHPHARRFVCSVLQELPSLADRVAVVERLGSGFLPPPQFVDDLTAPCPSEGAVRGVLGDEPSAACNRYARRVKACINYGPGKSCVLPLLGAPPP